MFERINLWKEKFRAWRQNRAEIKNVVHNIGQIMEEFELWMICYHKMIRSQLIDKGSSHKYLDLLQDNLVIVENGEEIFDTFLRHKNYLYPKADTEVAKLFHEQLNIRRPTLNKIAFESIQQAECKNLLKFYVKYNLVSKGDPTLDQLRLLQTDPKYHVNLSKFFSLYKGN